MGPPLCLDTDSLNYTETSRARAGQICGGNFGETEGASHSSDSGPGQCRHSQSGDLSLAWVDILPKVPKGIIGFFP